MIGLGWVQREGGPVEEIPPGDLVWFALVDKHSHRGLAGRGLGAGGGHARPGGDHHRLAADHGPDLAPAHADRSEQAQLPGALEHGEHQRVDDADNGDEDGQGQQGVDDGEQLVDLAGLILLDRRRIVDDQVRIRDDGVADRSSNIARRTGGLDSQDDIEPLDLAVVRSTSTRPRAIAES